MSSFIPHANSFLLFVSWNHSEVLKIKLFFQQEGDVPLLVIPVAGSIFSLVLCALLSVLGITVHLFVFDGKIPASLGF